ncbi:MAG: hypothetical protein AB7H97_02765 [Pseudobdellovibrionaceae bacterium]
MRLVLPLLIFVLAGCKADQLSKTNETSGTDKAPRGSTCPDACWVTSHKIEVRGFKNDERYQIRIDGKTLWDDCDNSVDIIGLSPVPIYENDEDFFRGITFWLYDEFPLGERTQAKVFLYGPNCDLIQPPLYNQEVTIMSESHVSGEGECQFTIPSSAIYFTF